MSPGASSYYSIPQINDLSPGGSPITTNKFIYSLALFATALISNEQKIPLPTTTVAMPDNAKQAVAASEASLVVIGGQTQVLSPAGATARPVLTFAGSTYTVNIASAFIIGSQTLPPGGIITISGTPMSEALGANAAVIAGQTQFLSSATIAARPILTFAGSIYTADTASAFTIDGQTLSPGGITTVSGTPISLASSPTEPPKFAFNRSIYTANLGSPFLINSQTLTKDGMVTVAGTPISYASNGGDVVVGTSTEVGIGGLIMSGFKGGSVTSLVKLTGAAMRCKGSLPWVVPMGAVGTNADVGTVMMGISEITGRLSDHI